MAFKTREDEKETNVSMLKDLRIKHGPQEREGRLDEVKVVEDDRAMGTHVFGNLYRVDRNIVGDATFLKKTIEEAVNVGNMRLVDIKAISFGERSGGITIIAIMQGSHVALHTWLEYNYATLDVYAAGTRANPDKAFDYVVSKLRPKRHQKFRADRSQVDL